MRAAERIEAKARRTTRQAAPWVEGMARLGYAAQGVLYLAMGVIAARAAFGADAPEGSSGALRELFELPVGSLLVGALGAGLLCYSVWRLVRAIANPEHDGIGSRLYSVATAFGHLVLFMVALGILTGQWHGAGTEAPKHWTARVLEQPLGRWIVLVAAAGFLANGIRQWFKAVTAKVDDELDFGEMNEPVRRSTVLLARLGLVARAVVFTLIGASLGHAGMRFNPEKAEGVSGVLRDVERQSYGQILLGLVAAGFIAYGVYELIRARYRRVPT